MSLRFIYGRAGSGKSTRCLEEIHSAWEQDSSHPLFLIVPEQFSLQAEKELVKFIGASGLQRAEVLSFRRLAYRVLTELGGITRKYIGTSGKSMIIYRVLSKVKGELRVFARAAGQMGFGGTLVEMFREFKRYEITPDMLGEVAGKLKNEDPLRQKISELSRLYGEYNSLLNESYSDPEEDLTVAAQRIERSVQFRGARIWVDGFNGFTPQEFSILSGLMKIAEEITVCLCTDSLESEIPGSESDVFAPARNTYRKMKELARRNGVPLDKPIYLDRTRRFDESPVLSHLEKNYFAFPYQTYGGPAEGLVLISALDPFAEVERTAEDILNLCRTKGYRFRDIAVACRNLEEYGNIVSAVFEEYSIPFFLDQKREITSHPLVRLVLSAIEVLLRDWAYEPVFSYLKTGYAGLTDDETDRLENYCLAWGIRGSRWLQDEEWDFVRSAPDNDGYGPGEWEKCEEEIVDRLRRIAALPLNSFKQKMRGGRKTAAEISAALYDLLDTLNVPEKITRQMEHFRKTGRLEEADELRQVWNSLMELMDELVEVMGDETVSLETFSGLLTAGLSEYRIGMIPPSLDQVLVGSLERTRSHSVKALFLLGVNDGVFPAPPGSEGILSDHDRQVLRGLGVELAQDTRAKAIEEQFLVYQALSLPSHYLQISYPIADPEGRALRPSQIISRIRKIIPQVKEYSGLEESSLLHLGSRTAAYHQLISKLRRKLDTGAIEPLWEETGRWFASQSDWREKKKEILEGFMYNIQPMPIRREKLRKFYGSTIRTSVSRLEKYAGCPFSYFVQYGLKAQERKKFGIQAPDTGTFLHAVLDRIGEEMEKSGLSWRTVDREWCNDAVSRIVDGLLGENKGLVWNRTKRYHYLAMRLKRVLARAVWTISLHIKRSGFEPLGYEVAFGDGESFPPIEIELADGQKILLTGRIDRIDKLETDEGTYVRIIDYKSGTRDFKLGDLYYGLQLQLITYLDAVMEQEGQGLKAPVHPAGILYFHLDDPLISAKERLTEEEAEKKIMKALQMKGLLLADVKLLREMDHEMDGSSDIIPVRILKNGELGKSSTATADQFSVLKEYVKKLISTLCTEMVNGEISVSPYKNKQTTACRFCPYQPVCSFDMTLPGSRYRNLAEMKENEIWQEMRRQIEKSREMSLQSEKGTESGTQSTGRPDTGERSGNPASSGGQSESRADTGFQTESLADAGRQSKNPAEADGREEK